MVFFAAGTRRPAGRGFCRRASPGGHGCRAGRGAAADRLFCLPSVRPSGNCFFYPYFCCRFRPCFPPRESSRDRSPVGFSGSRRSPGGADPGGFAGDGHCPCPPGFVRVSAGAGFFPARRGAGKFFCPRLKRLCPCPLFRANPGRAENAFSRAAPPDGGKFFPSGRVLFRIKNCPPL